MNSEEKNIKDTLAKEYKNFTYRIEKSKKNGRNTISMETKWDGTKGVNCVEVYLAGINALRGAPIQRERARVELTPTQKCGILKDLTLDGEFELHFCAHLSSGEHLDDFRKPVSISLSCDEGKRSASYKTKVKGDYTRLTVEKCNFERVGSNKVWLFYNGHYQLLPKRRNEAAEEVWYIPSKGEVKIIQPEEHKLT